MKTIINRILSLSLVFTLLFTVSASALQTDAKGAISMNVATGEVYYEKNADVLMTPASLTKIMTLYIVFEKMSGGEFTKDTLIPVSANAAKASHSKSATNIPLSAGESLSAETLINAIVIVSACACSTVFAEYISGSESEFVNLMNETAKNMGLNAKFTDASGLSGGNLITPRSVATLVHQFITKYPDILSYTSKASEVIDGSRYYSTNYLLSTQYSNYYFSGADGFKTGTTKKAGRCIAATAKRGADRVIAVVMNSSSDKTRYADSIALLSDALEKASYISGNMFSTDIKAYINGNEIPCYYKKHEGNEVCITAEELRFYGFDTYYDSETATLYITENPDKEISPLPCEKSDSAIAHKVCEHPNLKVVLVKGNEKYTLKTAISLGGQCAISIDELGSYYLKTWDNDTRKIEITTK